MTNFLILPTGTPENARGITIANGNQVFGCDISHLQNAPRHRYIERASSSTTMDISYLLGNGSTAIANFFAIARADLLRNENVNLRLRRGTSGYTTQAQALIDTLPLLDRRAQDAVFTFSNSASWQNWQLRFETSTTSKFKCSKVFFGEALDAELEPSNFQFSSSGFKSDRAATESPWTDRYTDQLMSYTVEWSTVTKAVASKFNAYFRRRTNQQCFIYLVDNSTLLAGYSLAHVQCESFDVKQVSKDRWEMYGSFTEL